MDQDLEKETQKLNIEDEEATVSVESRLQQEFTQWAHPQKGLIFLQGIAKQDSDDVALTFNLDKKHQFTLKCPSAYPNYKQNEENFFVEGDSGLSLWCYFLNEFLLDARDILSLTEILRRGLSLYDDHEKDDVEDEDALDPHDQDDDHEEVFETERSQGFANRRLLWRAKEAQLRSEQARKQREAEQSLDQIWHSQIATKQASSWVGGSGILMNDLKQIMALPPAAGIEADSVEDNIFQWTVKLRHFRPGCALSTDLVLLQEQFGFDYIELQLDFSTELHPFFPPLVRVIRPRLQGSTMLAPMAMDLLKPTGWQAIRHMHQVILHIQAYLEQTGKIDLQLLPAGGYLCIESHLFSLSLLSGVHPRVMSCCGAEAVRAAVNSSSVEAQHEEQDEKDQTWSLFAWLFGNKDSDDPYESYRPKVEAQRARVARGKRKKQMVSVLRLIHAELEAINAEKEQPSEESIESREIFEILEASALIPFLESVLKMASMDKFSKNHTAYRLVIDIIREICSQPGLLGLLGQLPLYSLKQQIHEQLREREKFDGRLAQALIRVLSDAIKRLVALNRPAVAHSYETLMRPMQLNFNNISVEGLKAHAFASLWLENPKVDHELMPHLAQEISSLSSSLPLSLSSGIFVQSDPDKPMLLKALITGPEGTPYTGGCYQFDIYFPPSYPRAPPKVFFCTTGGDFIRFGPNLSEDGGVCLPFLGTARGAEEDRWHERATLIQVLVSIQRELLCSEPYHELSYGTSEAIATSREHTRSVLKFNLRIAILEQIRAPAEGFEGVIKAHFYSRRETLIKELYELLQDYACKETVYEVYNEVYSELTKLSRSCC